MPTGNTTQPLITPATSSTLRRRMWRRRALLRKGARLYGTIMLTRHQVSLAMLDEDGIVISWHERARGLDRGDPAVIDHHFSQLYVAEDIALGVPARDLCNATIHGIDTQKGWRRDSEGVAFWATTIIKPLLLRDGRLQGFSYMSRRMATPWGNEQRTDSWFSDSRTATTSTELTPLASAHPAQVRSYPDSSST